jgi:lipid-A-disaccharide synthase-like uncharacterized protein
MFPPHVTPPGVFVSEDRAEVCAPHSLAGSLLLLAIILLTVSDIFASCQQSGLFHTTLKQNLDLDLMRKRKE